MYNDRGQYLYSDYGLVMYCDWDDTSSTTGRSENSIFCGVCS